jgi:hypothetical protein
MLLSQFSAIFDNLGRKNGIFLKNQCKDQIFELFSYVLSNKTPNSLPIFWRKYFKNRNIGPCCLVRSNNTSKQKLNLEGIITMRGFFLCVRQGLPDGTFSNKKSRFG